MSYTPCTDYVEDMYEWGRDDHSFTDEGERRREFRRWFAAEEQRIRTDERAKIAAKIRGSSPFRPDDAEDANFQAGLEVAARVADA